MNDKAVSLNPDENAEVPRVTVTAPQASALLRGVPMKFTYPTGARPLEGYTIKRGLGAGGFGEVYYATSDAGKEVALKHIQRNLDIELRGVSQCLNLKHPNLVALFDIRYDDEGEAWVVMEHVAGESLKDAIEQYPQGMPLPKVKFWLGGIAAGVAYLHNHGIVHRDLKPGNIFVDDELVKIGDYGLSKFISCSRRSGHTESVGTFHYMAPEIGRGNYGKEIDVYALGVIVYEMLTGRVPFDGESTQEIMMKHLTDQPDLSVLPVELAGPIGRALEKDPAKRFRTVGDLVAALGLVAPNGAMNAIGAGMVTGNVNGNPAANGTGGTYAATAAPRQATSQEVVAAEVVGGPEPQEPIARCVHRGWHSARRGWEAAGFGLPTKLALGAVGLFLLVTQAGWLVPFVMVLGVFYGFYMLVRLLTLSWHEGAPEPPRSAPPQASTQRISQTQMRSALADRTTKQRTTELIGSLATSAIASAVLAVVMTTVGKRSMSEDFISWAPLLAWLTIIGTAGSWGVLILGKTWETRKGEQLPRRFAMLAGGLALGVLAFWLTHTLAVDFTSEQTQRAMVSERLHENMFDSYGRPLVGAYLAYFGGLMMVLRWWKLSDPLRAKRVSVWGTAACGMWGWLLHLAWPVMHPWGLMLAVSIALAVQISSPWIDGDSRRAMQQRIRGEV